MAAVSAQSRSKAAWRLARKQHGVIALFQLVALGYTEAAIRHRLASGRLHVIYPGVYAVGRAEVTQRGRWMAAVLACAPSAVLSHESAAALWRMGDQPSSVVHVSVPVGRGHRHRGVVAHRRTALRPQDVTREHNIPTTTPIRTLVDLAVRIPEGPLEAAINEADKLDLVTPVQLRAALEERRGQRGVGVLRALLDRSTFILTDSELERRFVPIAVRAGLPAPLTQQWVNGFRVDFFWPELSLIVETDGLTYHRTAQQQARDRIRDQAHAAAGLTWLRFTHWQVCRDPVHVARTLGAVAGRLARRSR